MSSTFMAGGSFSLRIALVAHLSRSAALGRSVMFAQLGGGVIGLCVRGVAAAADVGAIRGYGARNFGGKIRVLPHEFRSMARGKTHEIVEDEHLAVAIGAGADADGGDAQLLRDA